MNAWLRRREPLVAIALGVVLTTSTGIAAVRSSYGTLGFGSGSGLEGRGTTVAGGEGFVRLYADRTVVRGILSIRNNGRWPVRVEKVGTDPDEHWHGLVAYRPDLNVLNPPNLYAYDGPAFVPFTLAAGEERPVSVALWMDNCEHNAPGVSNTIDTVPVRYRVGGMVRTTWIELADPWTITTDGVRCPRPRA